MSHLLKRLRADSTPNTASKPSTDSPAITTALEAKQILLQHRLEALKHQTATTKAELVDVTDALMANQMQHRLATLVNPMGLPYEEPVETGMTRGSNGRYKFEVLPVQWSSETLLRREDAEAMQQSVVEASAEIGNVWSKLLTGAVDALTQAAPVTTGTQPLPQRLVEQVSETTRGRRDNYGRPLINFLRIAAFWTEYMENRHVEVLFTPEDVAQFQTLLKIARQEHGHQDDNLLDVMGYQDCLDDMHRHMQELGFPEGIAAFRTMTKSQLDDLRWRLS